MDAQETYLTGTAFGTSGVETSCATACKLSGRCLFPGRREPCRQGAGVVSGAGPGSGARAGAGAPAGVTKLAPDAPQGKRAAASVQCAARRGQSAVPAFPLPSPPVLRL